MKKLFTYKNKLCILYTLGISFLITVASAQTKYVVSVTNNVFTPDELKINVGDTVEWQNTEGWHNVNGTKATYPDNPESFGNSSGNNWVYSYVFKVAGRYDYQCDPHVNLGMTGKIEVEAANNDDNKHMLTINFTDMNPHNGQNLYLSVVEKDSGKEVERKTEDINVTFSAQISGIETDHSYVINFFADHNGNGMYDTPPTDHAWQMELNGVTGDTILNFAHNTNFTDIMWKNKLTVNFTGMDPHDDQTLHLRLIEKDSGTEIYRTSEKVSPEFSVGAFGIEKGKSYNVDFYSDHNGNGLYDAPPADHAWRLELNNVMADTVLNFAHNTNFTDIEVSTGVSKLEPTVDVIVYPNPASSFVKIEFKRISNDINIELFDITGKKHKLKPEVTSTTVRLELTTLHSGIYFLHITEKDTQSTYKLIKR